MYASGDGIEKKKKEIVIKELGNETSKGETCTKRL